MNARGQTMPDRELRDAIIKRISLDMYKAEKSGRDAFKVAGEMYPGTPIEVLAVAYCRATDALTEEWWQTVEDTIDGEVVRKAIVTISGKAP